MKNIGVLAGDLRQHYIADNLKSAGFNTKYLYSFQEFPAYVVPVPFTRDGKTVNSMLKNELTINDFIATLKAGDIIFGGNIPETFINEAKKLNVKCHDFMKCSDVVWANAYLTAEGLLSKIIESTSFSLKDSNIFIIGYGKCGSLSAKLLAPLCKNIFVYDHTPKHLHELEANGFIPLELLQIEKQIKNFNIVINTVPQAVLTNKHYSFFNKDSMFFEIASFPFGLDKEILDKHSLCLITCPGIPGKSSPKTAGEIISRNIIEQLERTDKNDP